MRDKSVFFLTLSLHVAPLTNTHLCHDAFCKCVLIYHRVKKKMVTTRSPICMNRKKRVIACAVTTL